MFVKIETVEELYCLTVSKNVTYLFYVPKAFQTIFQ